MEKNNLSKGPSLPISNENVNLVEDFARHIKMDDIKLKRNRKSALDPYLKDILEMLSASWSYQKILDNLNYKNKLKIRSRSTIYRFVREFIDG